ncbi:MULTISPECIES: acyl carrier protein [Kitasatospora]|uniref:Acyl carrier protein n=1 Tax=Kitasatospora cathayae TaxID=3004092 RepID=A0ABY7Q7W5_9ACTN|nr:acyl carrier protein [Kitasatospora sp. HUAS 3-15]WBP88269.1 acyl carrier protein [Kitasatospora sp. HUAS 3-15]
MQELTIDDLRRILREAAGQQEGVDLDGDILDLAFDELGYDSLALLETGSRIEQIFGIRLDDNTLSDSPGPRALIAAVNEQLAAARTA